MGPMIVNKLKLGNLDGVLTLMRNLLVLGLGSRQQTSVLTEE
jgi:hypothetical protein